MNIRPAIFSILFLVALPAAAAPPPHPVSPATVDGTAMVRSVCPAFIWTPRPAAVGYELVVYGLEEGSPAGEPVLRQTLPAGASAWVPSAESCLEAGETYAWLVRAIDGAGVGDWSDASLFEVATFPGPEELEEALEVVRRHLEEGGELPGPRKGVPSGNAPLIAAPLFAAPDAPKPTATAAVADFSVSGAGHVTSRKLTVGANAASATHLATFANTDFNAARVRLTGRNLIVDVGPTLSLDATGSSSGGRSYSLISTANNATGGPGKLGIWDDASSRHYLLIDAVADSVKVRNLAVTITPRSASAGGGATALCQGNEVVSGGGCFCGSNHIDVSYPPYDFDLEKYRGWSCICSGTGTATTAYVMCLDFPDP